MKLLNVTDIELDVLNLLSLQDEITHINEHMSPAFTERFAKEQEYLSKKQHERDTLRQRILAEFARLQREAELAQLALGKRIPCWIVWSTSSSGNVTMEAIALTNARAMQYRETLLASNRNYVLVTIERSEVNHLLAADMDELWSELYGCVEEAQSVGHRSRTNVLEEQIAGLKAENARLWDVISAAKKKINRLQRELEAARAEQREKDAQVCDAVELKLKQQARALPAETPARMATANAMLGARECAEAIRARGQEEADVLGFGVADLLNR
jgi:hypothetical protein